MPLSSFKQKFVSFIFQPICCLCEGEIELEGQCCSELERPSQSVICHNCHRETINSHFDRCYFCGSEISPLNPFGSRCASCRDWNSPFERAIAIGKYRDRLKQTIIEIKRESNATKAYQLGVLLGEVSRRFDLSDEIDFAIPVPSHWRRRWSRHGLHVADVIADGFCKVTGTQKLRSTLKCVRYTKKQSKLRPGQRIKNVRHAFKSNSHRILSEARILLIDDVMTSGATVNECTKVLLKSGVRSVFVAVAARATGVS